MLDRQAEHLREDTPQVDHSLRRFVQRKSLPLPYRGGCMRLQGVMRLKWRDVRVIERDRSIGERRVGIAALIV